MKYFVATTILIFLFVVQIFGCVPTNTKRNSELVVTYEGEVVHRANSVYATRNELTRLINSNRKKNIIFGSDWCQNCKLLYKALKQSGHLKKTIILNVDETWVARFHKFAGLDRVPTMLVASPSGVPISIHVGASKIVMYLLLNAE